MSNSNSLSADYAAPSSESSGAPACSRFQFRLRSLFILVTVAAVGAALCPKSVDGFVPFAFCATLTGQMGLAVWAVVRKHRQVAAQPKLGRGDALGFGTSLVSGVAFPLYLGVSVALAAMRIELFSEGVMLALIAATLLFSPIMLILISGGQISRARLPLFLLHLSNVVVIVGGGGFVLSHLPSC
ncbi:MAG: hypothetical protein K8T25_11715 [Planctomycetia bacterium]|nr:hypothetical protein [Planctomycetia bacterium]